MNHRVTQFYQKTSPFVYKCLVYREKEEEVTARLMVMLQLRVSYGKVDDLPDISSNGFLFFPVLSQVVMLKLGSLDGRIKAVQMMTRHARRERPTEVVGNICFSLPLLLAG